MIVCDPNRSLHSQVDKFSYVLELVDLFSFLVHGADYARLPVFGLFARFLKMLHEEFSELCPLGYGTQVKIVVGEWLIS